MKTLTQIIITMLMICSLVLPVFAEEDEQIRVELTINGKADIYIETIDGQRSGSHPAGDSVFSGIEGAAINTTEKETAAVLPSGNIYHIWLNSTDPEEQPAYRTTILTENWNAELIGLYPLAENPTLVINPPESITTDENLLYEKLTILAQPDAFPAINFHTDFDFGKCSFMVEPTFSILTSAEAAEESEAKMTLTLFPAFGRLALKVAALDHLEDYENSKFILNTHITCSNDEETVYAVSLRDQNPVLHEHGTILINFKDLMRKSPSFLAGDFDGDLDYETSSAENYFEFIQPAEKEESKPANIATADAIRERGYLRVGTPGDYAPMSWRNPETGLYEGFDVELAYDLADDLGVDLIQFVPSSWPTLMEDTLAGEFDLAICGITITDARKEQALMSDGYLGNGKTMLIRAEDADRFKTLADINRPEVLVIENPGGLNEKFARENLPDATLIIHSPNDEIPYLIAEGEADVMITEIMEAGYYVGKDDRLAAPLIYEPFTNGQLGVLIPPENADLLDYVNEFLTREKDSGRIDTLASEYIYRYIPQSAEAK